MPRGPVPVCCGRAPACARRGVRLLQAASQHLRLPQGEATERLKVYSFHRNGLFQRLREQRHGVGDRPARVYAAPKAAAIRGNRIGRSAS